MIDLNLNYRKLAQQLGISLGYIADLFSVIGSAAERFWNLIVQNLLWFA